MRKYYLIAELLVFKYRPQNISVSNTFAYCRHLSGSDVVLWKPVQRSRDRLLWAVWGIPTCSSLIKVQRWTASIIEMSCFINSFCQPFMTCLATSLLFNRDRAAVSLWNTRFYCSSSVASQQSWPEPGRLPDVGEASQPDAWCWAAECTPDQRVGTFPLHIHRWSDQAVASTSSSLQSSTWMTLCSYVWYLTDIHFENHMYVW